MLNSLLTHSLYRVYLLWWCLASKKKLPVRSSLTEQTKQFASVQMVVDKIIILHGPMMQETLWSFQVSSTSKGINDISIRFNLLILLYSQVDAEVCEQVFSWLSRISKIGHTRWVNILSHFISLIYIFDLRNIQQLNSEDSESRIYEHLLMY